MPIRHGNTHRAFGWLILILVLLPSVLSAQQETEEPPATLEQSQGTAIEAPAPQSETPKPSVQQEPTAAQPPPAAPVENERPAEPSCDARCQETKQREEDDLKAQESMASSAEDLVVITWWQFGAGVVGVSLLFVTLYLTRQATNAATRSADAAQEAVKAAQQQAGAAILLEAAKIVFSRADFSPVGGGVITSRGIPEDGLTPHIKLKNIGKTRAFILKTCIVLRVSNLPPERRYPMASQVQRPVAPGIPADTTFSVRDRSLTVSLTDQQRSEIQAGREHIWLLVGVWFKDWFGVDRHEEIMLRWKPDLKPGDPPGTLKGFITHDDAQ